MNRYLLLFLSALLFFCRNAAAQDTFSICAVDTVTGEVGSAGASCIDANSIAGGVVIISDVHPGIGVIHTQASYVSPNQNFAKNLMNKGFSPQKIIDSTLQKDYNGTPNVRQYGVVDLYNGKARVASYTGTGCLDYKNHIKGKTYSIQGNILLGQQILDSMEARFNRETGDLACKLMAALQGAKVKGADKRCVPSGNSSLSSFLRLAKKTDTPGMLTLNLIVDKGPYGFEPIDSLQTLFNKAHNCPPPPPPPTGTNNKIIYIPTLKVYPNPSEETITFHMDSIDGQHNFELKMYDHFGKSVKEISFPSSKSFIISRQDFSAGIYFYKISDGLGFQQTGKVCFK